MWQTLRDLAPLTFVALGTAAWVVAGIVGDVRAHRRGGRRG
ncbi:hypothetical protein [Amycolatopsis sp. lyj-23]